MIDDATLEAFRQIVREEIAAALETGGKSGKKQPRRHRQTIVRVPAGASVGTKRSRKRAALALGLRAT